MTALSLAQVIAYVESRGNVNGVHLDLPTFLRWNTNSVGSGLTEAQGHVIDVIMQIHGTPGSCSRSTACMIACSSFGRFQIEGETLYSTLQYRKPIAAYWNNPVEQLDSFEAFLTRHELDQQPALVLSSPALMLKFATIYNGPADPYTYVTRMRQAMAALGDASPFI